MSDEPIAQDVRALLYESIETFEDLEVVLLLRETGRTSTARQVCDALGFPADAVTPALDSLVKHGLVERVEAPGAPRYRFAAPPECAAAVDALAGYWQTNRYDVVRLLGQYSMERVRGSATRAFADAYALGRRNRER